MVYQWIRHLLGVIKLYAGKTLIVPWTLQSPLTAGAVYTADRKAGGVVCRVGAQTMKPMHNVLYKEFERDPEGFFERLLERARQAALREHNFDMVTVTTMLFKFTKDQPDSEPHQIVLGMLKKYKLPDPKLYDTPPGKA